MFCVTVHITKTAHSADKAHKIKKSSGLFTFNFGTLPTLFFNSWELSFINN